MERKAEIYSVSGKIDDWDYEGYEIKFIDEEGKESFERVVFSKSDVGNSFLVMELKENPEKEFFVNKLRTFFTYDSYISLRKAINQSDCFSCLTAKSKAIRFTKNYKNVIDLVSKVQLS